MQIAIICGGLATRLENLAKNIPKSMIEIQEKPFLEYQIENCKKNGIKDFVLCVGHLSDYIENYFGSGKKFNINIKYSHDGDKLLGPIGALKNAETLLDDIFFMMYGDSYVFVDFEKVYDYFQKTDNKALMTVFQNCDKIDISNVVIKNKKVVKYNKEKTKDMLFIDYGVSIFRKKILDEIPKNTFYSTKDLFSNLVDQDNLLSYEIKKRFYHIGTPESLKEFTDYIKSLK